MNTISGKTEFDIFKNYYTAEKSEGSKFVINTSSFQSKDDVRSEHLRGLVKADFAKGKYNECLKKYSECLRYATYHGRQFAMALANRSATYLYMKKYENCIIDINLCLQADYPNVLKPKLFIRKATCFCKMGNFKDMMKTIDDCSKQIQDISNLPKIDKDNYLKKMESLLDIKLIGIEDFFFEDGPLANVIVLEKNRLNPNVSASIELKYNKDTGTDYVASRDIPCGEVLFVDTAYSVGCLTMDYEELGSTEPFICDYCYMEARNCIPCKICVKFMYCSENCRDEAWTELHQWECDMFRSNILPEELSLPYRTMIKAALSGAIFQIPNDTKPYNSTDTNPYVHIYGFHLDFESVRSNCKDKLLVKFCKQVVYMVEFLIKADFFTVLMSTASCQKDYSTLVDLVGGLLLRHIIQGYQRSLVMKYTSTIVLDNYSQELFEMKLVTNSKFHAFCPAVSGVKYSCESNTSMYFNGSTCIVKACKNIKAGNRIFRSGFNLEPMMPFLLRTTMLQDVKDINCDCAACENDTNRSDNMDNRCRECGNLTFMVHQPAPIFKCINCKLIAKSSASNTTGTSYESTTGFGYGYTMMMEDVYAGIDVTSSYESWFKILIIWSRAYYECIYDLNYEFILFKSKEEFKKALQKFRNCAENKNRRFNAFDYVLDLAFICKAALVRLEFRDSNLQKNEIVEILNYVSDVVQEAKDISEYTFPPLLRLFAPIEFRIIRSRLDHVTFKDL